MLQDMRDNAQGTIAKVIIGLLIVSLSIWGMDAIVGGFSGEPEVATVNGEDVTEREFLRVVQMESQRRLSEMDDPDPSMLDEDQVRRDVLESLIQEKVLTQDAEAQGLELSDQDIDSLITQMPQFQVDGSFNRDRFVSTVRNMGMGVGEFRETMRKQYVVNQIRAGIEQSATVADENVAQLLRIQNQTRDFRAVTLAADTVRDEVEVTDAEIEAYYQDNDDEFQQPERVDARYIALSREALAESVDVTDEQLQEFYEERSSELAKEERRASHILIEDGADADETMATIQQRLEDGEAFSDLAKEFSIDTSSAEQGGDLGFAERGVYDSAFEDALFALEEGEVSEPVSTSFGVHLIRLDDVQKADTPPLEEVEDELRRELAEREAAERFAEVRSELADLAYAADDLAGPAEELGLEVREKSDITEEGGDAPFDHSGLVRQLFSDDVLKDGFNTELIDVGDNISVVARVSEYYEAQKKPLEEVSEEIRTSLIRQKTREALQERADTIIADLESGKSLDDLDIGEWQSYEDQSRNNLVLGNAVMAEVFSLSRPDDDSNVFGSVVSDDRVTILALDAVNDGEVDRDGEEFRQLRGFLASLEGQREYSAYRQYLRDNSEIERQ
ncbi:SurA N-terminal domain-containing protein [Marinobacter sp. HL-58]|uniref:SurA N-terminal domain-containing protein n=1 Tax=Marinobacter sp. HL-58 TaxID=1479237 RepID=UPI000480A513|nr:SurA N-terminal domain-containing protein [Marinobacter sp. HL-58]KPP99019.1 MAG: peptidyl-prolyl cis-trans isomerase D [Marinobacter sp. HL-58]